MPFIPKDDRYDLADLLALMTFLRSPQGCPWDRAQNLHSLQPYLIEESYECLAAEAAADMPALREELGDVLLQVVFQSQIAEEKSLFAWEEVVDGLCRKLVRRHSHLFAADRAADAQQVKDLWEQNKAKEKAEEALPEEALAAVKLGQSPLALAWALQDEAARHYGFDWPDVLGPLEKLHEEADELAAAYRFSRSLEDQPALSSGAHHSVPEAAVPSQSESEVSPLAAARGLVEDELGDLFFALVNLARKLEIRPESALAAANTKFARRFNAAAALAGARGQQFSALPLADQDALWDEIKGTEGRADRKPASVSQRAKKESNNETG